jgi:hypothetical protein
MSSPVVFYLWLLVGGVALAALEPWLSDNVPWLLGAIKDIALWFIWLLKYRDRK